MTFSIIAYKATRGPRILADRLDRSAVLQKANEIYDSYKCLFKANLAQSGVAIMIVTDDDADALAHEGVITCNEPRILEQYGGF